jgi:hypothetical protein
MIAVVEHNSSRRSAQVEMKDVVVIILVVVVVAVEVACDITSIQKASHHRSRPVSGSYQYLSQKRLSSHVVHELQFTLINDDNAGEMRLTTKTSCAKFKIWRFEFEIVSFYWLKNSLCVDRSTRQIRRSTHKKPDFGVLKSKIRVSQPPTQ